MAQKFIKKGYEVIDSTKKADIYIINTCTVTNMSDRKSRQMIRKTKELNPNAIIVACGCYAQVAKEELEKIEDIDLILGNNEKKDIVKHVEDYIDKNNSKIQVQDIMNQKEYVEFGNVTYTEKTRAVIKVQDGCDRFCTYCIIPYARGRVRSRKPENILSEIKQIAKKGIQEVVITGIHIASYGKDFQDSYQLIDLLEEINTIEGIKRIRLGSLEPLLITQKFLNRLKKLEKICHHFHLSLQSGCDETLKRMNRRYTTDQFRKIVQLLRNTYSDVMLTTDIIVGFPGETEKEFQTTYQFLQEINFYKMHIFKYSPRKGTKAAQMKEQVSGDKKEQRSRALMDLSDENQKKYHQSYLNREVEVLFEEEKNGTYHGHTDNYILAYCKTSQKIENQIKKVQCKEIETDHILVEL